VKILVALVVAVLLVAGCGGSGDGVDERAGAVEELKSIDTLRTAFARADGSPRLLLLLSPT
jgi:outer membrane murein-binding lipoprotein Lpp